MVLLKMCLKPDTSAHACNLSYLGGRDQEDSGSKPKRANSLGDTISKKSKTKQGLME
jgi:hypothetical protein